MPVGSQVTAWLSTWVSDATTQQATQIKDAAPLPPDNRLMRLDVIAAASDVSGGQLRAQGRPIAIPSNLQSQFPDSPAPILLEATLQNGVLTATSVQVRSRPQDLGGEIVLKGAVAWDGKAGALTLREASVAIDANTTIGSNCPQSPQSLQLVFLEVHAERGAPGTTPRATSITCLSAPPADGVIRQGGVVQSIAGDFQSLTVTLDGQTIPTTMVLFAGTRLPPNDPNSLVSQHVDVEYQVVAGRNQLRSLRPSPPPSGTQ
jgi:hypothetical protein